MTISEQAVKAAMAEHNKYYDDLVIYPSQEPTPEGAFHAALKGALPFLPVQGAVKKLEWDEDGCAKTPFGMYTVQENAEDTWSFTFYDYPYGIPEGEFGTLDEAKAAAQADYDARIRSAIETVIPVSQPSAARVLALEEAFKAGAEWADECGSGDSPYLEGEAREYAIRALSSPGHADAGKVEGDGWQPIESAPKDGSAFMVFVAENEMGAHCFAPVSRDTDGGWWDDSTGDQIEPIDGATHWRPLPSAPASEGAE